jgi:prepilin-type N-terminal cleavage/methylation domain-containing protein
MKRRTPPPLTESGFTLLEALVVLIIAAVLAAIAAPSWFQYIANRRAQSVQTELKQVLEQAQTKARTTRALQYVEIDEAAAVPTVAIGTDLTDLTPITLAVGELRDDTVALDIAIRSSEADDATVAYNYQGAVNKDELFYIEITAKGTNRTYCLASLTLIGGVQSGADGECETFKAQIFGN